MQDKWIFFHPKFELSTTLYLHKTLIACITKKNVCSINIATKENAKFFRHVCLLPYGSRVFCHSSEERWQRLFTHYEYLLEFYWRCYSGRLATRADQHLGRNQMLWDAGLPVGSMDNITAVQAKVNIIRLFDIRHGHQHIHYDYFQKHNV